MGKHSKVEVVPLSEAIGAEVRGVDLSRDPDDATFEAIHRAWNAHLVLRFRDQRLSPAGLAAFSHRFGDLEPAPAGGDGTFHVEGLPEVLILSNVKRDGKPIGALGFAEAQWHTDMSYIDLPPMASLLYALEVPESGGDTGFCNMYAAYETLPDGIKERIAGRVLKHDAGHDSSGALRKGAKPVTDVTTSPGARHPIVRTHSETGRKALYLGRRLNGYICGLPLGESEELLDTLWAHATQGRFSWHQKWRPGDLIIWDNRCAMHRRDAFDAAARRIMHRTQVRGDHPH